MKPSREDALVASLGLGGVLPPDVCLGVGDDCAVVRGPKAQRILLKVDSVAEDIHFRKSDNPARVGWKALCRPLSDIAAMGGTPKYALVAIFSPPDVMPTYWKAFYRGLRKAAEAFSVTIVGGETSRQSAGIAASVFVTGEVAAKDFVSRAGGKSGDRLFVTGQLGGSLAGHHLDFRPRLAEGQWLASLFRPRAMMDLSDGLGSDLPRLAAASGCGFEVEKSQLPRRKGCSVEQALSDGEDYELLFAMPPRRVAALLAQWPVAFPKTPLTEIGTLRERGVLPSEWPGGWDHFATHPERKTP